MACSWRAADQARETLHDKDLRWDAEPEPEPELPPLLLRRWCPWTWGRASLLARPKERLRWPTTPPLSSSMRMVRSVSALRARRIWASPSGAAGAERTAVAMARWFHH